MVGPIISHEDLLKTVHYDPETGIFTWKINIPNVRIKIGDRAGYEGTKGYLYLKINKRSYRQGRLAWFYMTGSWPFYEIDHKDRNRKNHKFVNLRDVTGKVNCANYGQFDPNSEFYRGDEE